MARALVAVTMTLVLMTALTVRAEEPGCTVDGKVLKWGGEGFSAEQALPADGRDCLVAGKRVWVALGAAGVALYEAGAVGGATLVGSWTPAGAEVIGLRFEGGGVLAVTAQLAIVPLQVEGGQIAPATLSNWLGQLPATRAIGEVRRPVGGGETLPTIAATVEGQVVEVRSEVAVLDLGADQGIRRGDRFEIRSQRLTRQYSLDSGTEELLPSNQVTAVVEVKNVSADRTLVALGRGDRAEPGDRALRTQSPLTGDLWFPGYERKLNRIQGRIAPFLGMESLTAGTMVSALYDRTFHFPMRLEVGFRNVGFLFGEKFAAPFHADLVPSYDTDYFEVGIGGGYAFSSHEQRRGFTFVQKIRLGTVDGLNLTAWNSFIYQKKHEDPDWGWFESATSAAKVGDTCTPFEYDIDYSGHEFEWNSFDGILSIPLTGRVTLLSSWAYSQAGWFYGDIGIKTLVMGNGGHGTLLIPVSIGGVAVFDYNQESFDLYCSPSSQSYEKIYHWETSTFGGPVVSIGVDYRWK